MKKEIFLKAIGNRKFLFLDFETTGLFALGKYAPNIIEEFDFNGKLISRCKKSSYEYDDIIEIGYILIEPNSLETIDKGEYIVHAPKKLSKTIQQITGITQEQVDSGITQEELYEKMQPILDENPIIFAYNAKFDITFMYKWLNKMDLVKYQHFNFDVLDVMTAYANSHAYSNEIEHIISFDGIEKDKMLGHRLGAAIKTLCHRDLTQTHRALDDIEETITVFKKLDKCMNVYEFINVLGYHISRRERRYFYSLKPYHTVILPLGYKGNNYLEKMRKGEKVSDFSGCYIPDFIKNQNFNSVGLKINRIDWLRKRSRSSKTKFEQQSLF